MNGCRESHAKKRFMYKKYLLVNLKEFCKTINTKLRASALRPEVQH
jgi:hypothetical protein